MKPIAEEIEAARAIREALPDATLCADANCGLTLAAAERYAERTRRRGSLFIEQPLARRRSRRPEGPRTSHEDADRHGREHPVAGRYRGARKRAGAKGVSLKLIKLGGFREAFAAGKLCKRLGLKINVAAKIAE